MGSESVGQQVHEHLPAVGQDPEVVLGAGRQVRTVGATSTRMMPVAVVGPSVIVYDR